MCQTAAAWLVQTPIREPWWVQVFWLRKDAGGNQKGFLVGVVGRSVGSL